MEVPNLWEAGEMGWGNTMLSILRLKESLREESWEGAGSGNTRTCTEGRWFGSS